MKNIGFLALVILTTVLLTLAFSAAAAPSLPAHSAAVVAVPAAALVPPAHPHVTSALDAMRVAKGHLEQAEGEFHGHRAEAIKHLDAAIHEAEICEREP